MLQQQIDISPESIQTTVAAILISPAFRSSRQCCMLLRYIVDHSLAHEDDLLRERVIGAKVFGRPPDYDTGNDPVVRSRAAEVRKRLAQFYVEHRDAAQVHIAIPSGSYRAVFTVESLVPSALIPSSSSVFPESLPIEPEMIETPLKEIASESPRGARGTRRWSLLGGLLVFLGVLGCLLAVALLHAWHQRKENALFRTFWGSDTAPGRPTLVYIGANYAYRLSPTYLDGYRANHHLKNQGPEFFVDLKSGDSLPVRDLLPTNNLIGFGDVAATGRVAAALALQGKPYDLRYGDDVTISDLQSSPVILIGGFSNPWTMRLTSGLRYTLDQGDRVVDNKAGVVFRVGEQSDYAVVSRVPQHQTGGLVIAIAGVGTSANQAAADFISNPQRIADVLQNAPKAWDHKTLQILLRTSTIDDVPVSVEIKAVSFE